MTESDTLPPVAEPSPAPAKLTHEQLLEQMVKRLGVISFNQAKNDRDHDEMCRKYRRADDELVTEKRDLLDRIKALAEANVQVGQ